MEEGVLEKDGKELFRELLRLFPTAEVQDYCVNGVWRDEVMRLDLQILVGHRQEAGAPPPVELDEVEMPELPAERPKPKPKASATSTSSTSSGKPSIATMVLRKISGASGKGGKLAKAASPAATDEDKSESKVPAKPGLRLWQGGMSAAAKAIAAKAKAAAAKTKLQNAAKAGTPLKPGQLPLKPGQIGAAKVVKPLIAKPGLTPSKASDGSPAKVVKPITAKAGSLSSGWKTWTAASSNTSQASAAGVKVVPARPGFASAVAKAKAKAATKAFKLWGAARTVSTDRSQSWGSSQGTSWVSSVSQGAKLVGAATRLAKARGKGGEKGEPSPAARAAVLGVSRPKAKAGVPKASGAASAIADMRQIATFVTKFRMDPTKTKLLLAPLAPSRRRYVMQNFKTPVNGTSAVGKLQEYIGQCEKQNLWAGASASSSGAGPAGIGLRAGVKRPIASLSSTTLQNLAFKRVRMITPGMSSSASFAKAVGAKTPGISSATARSLAVTRSRQLAAAGKAAAAIRAAGIAKPAGFRPGVKPAGPTPPKHAPPGGPLKKTVPPRVVSANPLGASGAKRPATSWSSAPAAKVPKPSPVTAKVLGAAVAKPASLSKPPAAGGKGIIGKGAGSSGKVTPSGGKGKATFGSILSNANKTIGSNSAGSNQGSWSSQIPKATGASSRSTSASSSNSWSGGASKSSWDKGAGSGSWDKGTGSGSGWEKGKGNSGQTTSKKADNSWSSWSSPTSQQGQDKSSWKSNSAGGAQQWNSSSSNSQQWKGSSSSDSWNSQSGGNQYWTQSGNDYGKVIGKGSAKGSGKAGKSGKDSKGNSSKGAYGSRK